MGDDSTAVGEWPTRTIGPPDSARAQAIVTRPTSRFSVSRPYCAAIMDRRPSACSVGISFEKQEPLAPAYRAGKNDALARSTSGSLLFGADVFSATLRPWPGAQRSGQTERSARPETLASSFPLLECHELALSALLKLPFLTERITFFGDVLATPVSGAPFLEDAGGASQVSLSAVDKDPARFLLSSRPPSVKRAAP